MQPVPVEEIEARQRLLQELLPGAGVELALIRQAADLYYYSGVIVDGFLALGPVGEAVLLIRRPQNRHTDQDLPYPVAFYKDLRELPTILSQLGLGLHGGIGVELDVMPAALYRRLREQIFPQRPFQDLSPLIRRQRMIKSPYELAQISRAAQILDEVLEAAAGLITPGRTELELAADLEYRLRLAGHQGLVRTRTWNLEMFFGHVLSGAAGLQAAYVETPSGGSGFSHGFPQGAGTKRLAPGEPISVDLAACVNGYIADATRLYVIGDLPAEAWRAVALVEELFAFFSQEARPGVAPAELYQHLHQTVEKAGRSAHFMGLGPDRVPFVGHGVGLELDEFPIIGAKFSWPLAADMVVAFEPKFFLPDIGMVGFEDTGRITPDGVVWLTQARRHVFRLPH
ncbi:MAG: M24 family metallopeptidase [Desulfobacca sp.]|uniref:M24 family metallopeptidase n=1 Tax=Desulfobacca sp. TaxID=2067990 RepID=UPI00404983DD